MNRMTTPRKLMRNGKIGVVGGVIIILLMMMLPIIFPFAGIGFSDALLIFVGFIQIVLGVINLSKGRKMLQLGAGIDQPVDYHMQVPIESIQSQSKSCPSCGAKMPLIARFCPQCQLEQDNAILNLSTELPGADLDDLKILSDMGIKTLADIAEEDPTELSTILDVPIETVRLWIERARSEKKGITFVS